MPGYNRPCSINDDWYLKPKFPDACSYTINGGIVLSRIFSYGRISSSGFMVICIVLSIINQRAPPLPRRSLPFRPGFLLRPQDCIAKPAGIASLRA